MHADVEEIMLDDIVNIGRDEYKIYAAEAQLRDAEEYIDQCSTKKKYSV